MPNLRSKLRICALLILAVFILLPVSALADNIPKRITVAEVKALLDQGEELIYLDTRRGADWDASAVMIPGATRIADNAALAAAVKTLPRDGKIVTYCT